MYRLRHDVATNVLEIEAQGFWDLATITSFGVAAVAKGTAIRMRHGHFAIFVDVRAMPVQSAAVTGAIALLMPKARALTEGPIATVVANTLGKMQYDRVVTGERTRSFLDYDQARAWLHEEWIARSAARAVVRATV